MDTALVARVSVPIAVHDDFINLGELDYLPEGDGSHQGRAAISELEVWAAFCRVTTECCRGTPVRYAVCSLHVLRVVLYSSIIMCRLHVFICTFLHAVSFECVALLVCGDVVWPCVQIRFKRAHFTLIEFLLVLRSCLLCQWYHARREPCVRISSIR